MEKDAQIGNIRTSASLICLIRYPPFFLFAIFLDEFSEHFIQPLKKVCSWRKKVLEFSKIKQGYMKRGWGVKPTISRPVCPAWISNSRLIQPLKFSTVSASHFKYISKIFPCLILLNSIVASVTTGYFTVRLTLEGDQPPRPSASACENFYPLKRA